MDWRAFRLAHVGMSAQHNEYMVLAIVSQCITWFRSLLEDFGLTGEIVDMTGSLTDDPANDRLVDIADGHDFGNIGWDSSPVPTLGDNNAAITLGTEDLVTVQNRFYSRLCHYAKVAYEEGRTLPLYVPSPLNLADGFTKANPVAVFQAHFAQIRGLLTKPPVNRRLKQGSPATSLKPAKVKVVPSG